MINEIETYRKLQEERSRVIEALKDKLRVKPVIKVSIYSPDNIRVNTKNYVADIYLDKSRNDVEIYKMCSIFSELPTSEEEIAKYIQELNTEKQEFEKYIDDFFKAIQSKE
jgi:5,10-methylene-tetrahydrofolate dehydrogenase/methenyl tetrahydrofolate cyclohydrolase